MSSNMRPTGDRIMVRLARTVDKTESGLYLPEDRRPDNVVGTVLAVGPEYDGILQPGDQVVVASHGTIIRVNGSDVAIMPRSKVTCKVEP